MRRATSCMLARNSPFGKSTTRNVIPALQTVLPSAWIEASVSAKPEPSCAILADTTSACPGVTKVRSLTSFIAARNGIFSNLVRAMISQPDACAIASISSTPGISGRPGKCPSKIVLSAGTLASTRIVRSVRLRSMIRSMSWKYSIRIGPRTLLCLGGDQVVDAGAEVLQHEILLGRSLAVVDLLGPLLERQLDPEGLIDGKGDIQEVQAVDAEVVDRMAVGRDRVARNVAGLG